MNHTINLCPVNNKTGDIQMRPTSNDPATKKLIREVELEAAQALMLLGLSEQQSIAIVMAIHTGKIPRVTINY